MSSTKCQIIETNALEARVKELEADLENEKRSNKHHFIELCNTGRRLANAVLAARRWKELAQHAKEKLAELEQTTGDLCPVCGWSAVFPDGCSRCERSRLEATIEAARPVMRAAVKKHDAVLLEDDFQFDGEMCAAIDVMPPDQRKAWEE